MKNEACRSISTSWNALQRRDRSGSNGTDSGCRLRRRSENAVAPGGIARAGGLRHQCAAELLVAGAGPRGVVVARRDEAEAEAPRMRRIVEVGDRQRVLRRARPGRKLNAGMKQSRHWPQSFQSSTVAPGTVRWPADAGREVIRRAPGARAARTPRQRRRRSGARIDLAGAPAARLVIRRRLGADGVAVGVPVDVLPGRGTPPSCRGRSRPRRASVSPDRAARR